MDRNAVFWRGDVLLVLCSVMFEDDPVRVIDRVVRDVVKHKNQEISPGLYSSSIRTALRSRVELSRLVPNYRHGEQVTRAYLEQLAMRIEQDSATSPRGASRDQAMVRVVAGAPSAERESFTPPLP